MSLEENDEILAVYKELQNIHYPAGPLYKRTEKYRAVHYLKNNREIEAIYHLTESHSPALRTKATSRYEKFLNESEKKKKSANLSLIKNCVAFSCRTNTIIENVDVLLCFIRAMPKEWTIVQLTPHFNLYEHLDRSNEYHTNPIHITVFNCGTNQIPPFTVLVDAPRDKVNGSLVNLAEEMSFIIEKNSETLMRSKGVNNFGNANEKAQYANVRHTVDDRLKMVVTDLQKLWLKEWRCLLIGKFVNEHIEQSIKTQINEFFRTKYPNIELTKKTESLLSYLVKGNIYLSAFETKSAIQFCFPEPENKNLVISLTQFVRAMLSDAIPVEKKHPVILILDDTLDFFPWEMMDVLIDEPVSRMPSIHFVYALFKEHQSNIVDGYRIIEDYKKGSFIINPDLDLKKMESRMSSFYKYWLPDWKGITGRKPTESEFEKMLTSGNIFSYSGHGAGTQFLAMEKIEKCHINSVVLLFGCGSTKTRKSGPQAEMYGAYQMYLIACSPCVVGMLWEVTDVDTDMLTTQFISQWLPSDASYHWKYVDKTKWRRVGGEPDFTEMKIRHNTFDGKSLNEPDLLKALSIAKKVCSFYVTKAACVARGIPVKIKT